MIRTLQPGQRCEVWAASVSGESALVYSTEDVLLEAPNWTLDGDSLVLNGDGKLWKLDVAGASLTGVPLTGVPDLNNDHVLDPDGTGIYLSANDGHIYRAELSGGQAERITKDDGSFHFLHGVSPDGRSWTQDSNGDSAVFRSSTITPPASNAPNNTEDFVRGRLAAIVNF